MGHATCYVLLSFSFVIGMVATWTILGMLVVMIVRDVFRVLDWLLHPPEPVPRAIARTRIGV